jgi:hypothetical protein
MIISEDPSDSRLRERAPRKFSEMKKRSESPSGFRASRREDIRKDARFALLAQDVRRGTDDQMRREAGEAAAQRSRILLPPRARRDACAGQQTQRLLQITESCLKVIDIYI